MTIRTRFLQSARELWLSWSLGAILCSAVVLSEPHIAGRYLLETANGSRLPAVVAENKQTGYRQEVTSGSMVLGPDRDFTWRTAYRITEGGAIRTNESRGKGKYSFKGDVLVLSPEGNSASEGTLRDGILEVQADAKLVYRKEGGI